MFVSVADASCCADLDAWEPEHVRCWAEKLNLSPSIVEFLSAAGVYGAMLNAPKHRVVTTLQSCRRRLQAQQQQVPAWHELQQVAAQAVRLREEAKHVADGTTYCVVLLCMV